MSVGAIAVGGCGSRAEPSIRAHEPGKAENYIERRLNAVSVTSVSASRLNGARCTLREYLCPLTDSTCIDYPTPPSINHQVNLWTSTYALRGAASASPTCAMRSVAAPRLNTPPFVVGVIHDDPAVVGSEKSKTHDAHDAGSTFGYLLIPDSRS